MLDIKKLLTKILLQLPVKNTGNHLEIAGVHVCWGKETISATANDLTEKLITLPYTYSEIPTGFASCANRAAPIRTVYASPQTGGSTMYVDCYSTQARDVYVHWMTIGV